MDLNFICGIEKRVVQKCKNLLQKRLRKLILDQEIMENELQRAVDRQTYFEAYWRDREDPDNVEGVKQIKVEFVIIPDKPDEEWKDCSLMESFVNLRTITNK